MYILCIFTARKRSFRRLCFYRCLSVHGGVCLSACWETPQGDPPARETPLPRRPPFSRPTPRGKLRGIRSRPTPKGKIEGIRSRPTPKGEIKGDQIQAHTQGGNSGGSGPDPPQTTTAAGGTHPTGMHSCLGEILVFVTFALCKKLT